VREGDGRVVIQADNLGTNGLVCETTAPVQVSDEGPDRIIRGAGFLIKLEGVNTPGASVMNNFRCQ
jgi:hypothetical protein